MKIGAVFTGGTIGSTIGSDGFISVDTSEKYVLLEKYYEKYDKARETEFVIKSPYTILSENLCFDNIITLKKTIDAVKDEVDAVVVMHGTDTLQYTAGFLHFMLVTDIPIVLVSSAYVLDDVKANGLANLALAIEFSKLKKAGVFVSYVNSDGEQYIHAADKLMAHSSFSSDVYSIDAKYYARLKDGSLELNESCVYEKNTVPADNIPKKILFIHAYPGMDVVGVAEDTDAILIESYHSGTAPVTNALIELSQKAKQRNIPIYLVGINSAVSQYDSVKDYDILGIKLLYDEAPIAAYCRLSCAR